MPPQQPNANVRRFKSANTSLAKSMCSELVATANDAPAFDARLAELASSALAGTATWTLVANQFIGNRRAYRDRKAAIRAIKTHFDHVEAERKNVHRKVPELESNETCRGDPERTQRHSL